MERLASPAEVDGLLASVSNRGLLRGYLLFPEHREHAVRDFEGVPLRWIDASREADVTRPTFAAAVEPAEFFTFQVGVVADPSAARPVAVLGYEFVAGPSSMPMRPSQLNCFNLEGTSFEGRRFRQNASVQPGKVGSLWWGVNVSAAATPGQVARFGIRLRFAGAGTALINVTLTAARAPGGGAPLELHGDRNASR
jgi:hypothetical protein